MRRLNLQVSPTTVELRAANGQRLDVLGLVRAEVKVDGEKFTVDFIVVATLEGDEILLGDDFLRLSRAIINWATNSFEVLGDQPLRVCSALQQVVPPLSRKYIKVRTNFPLQGENLYEISGSDELEQRQLLGVQPGVVGVQDKFKLLMVNTSLRPAILMEGSTVAFANKVVAVETVPIREDDWHDSLDIATLAENDDREDASVVRSRTKELEINGIRFNVGADLSASEEEVVRDLLSRNHKNFAKHAMDLGCCISQHHCINTGNSAPISQGPRRLSPAQRDLTMAMVSDLLKAKIITPSRSPWASPLVLVKKKDGSTRMCVDYRKLNAVTESDVYPLPRIDDALAALSGSKYFSTLDLVSGFHQIQMNPNDVAKTAFITQWGLYEYQRMPFGLKGAPATCQRVVDNIIAGIKYKTALVYMDDCVVFSKTFADHVFDLEEVFTRFAEANLKFKPKKCFFFGSAVAYLGHVVTEDGISPDPEKMEAVARFPAPRNLPELQSFLGLTSYFRKFIPNYSITAAPLRKLLKKDTPFHWDAEQEEAFQALKTALCEPPVLKHFSDDARYRIQVHTDASRLGLGAILVQEDCLGDFRPVVYLSRSLRPAEENYTSTELEALAVKWALEQLRPYLMGRNFQVVTDHHALCWVLRYKEGNQRLLRWSLILQEFDFEVVFKSGASHTGPDCLSRTPAVSNETMEAVLAVSCDTLQADPFDISAEQQKDEFCRGIRDILDLKCGTKKQQKRVKNRFVVFEGVLYKKECKPLRQRYLLCLPKTQQLRVLEEYHAGKFGGHMGIRRTFEKIQERYYWPKMYSQVKRYVKGCDLCQRMKSAKTLYGLLQPVEASTPFHTVGLDIVGPFQSSRRYKYVVVAIDYLTKYIEAKPVTNIEASTIQSFIENRLVLKHGCPLSIITDRGTQMIAKSTQKYLEHRGIRHSPTTTYHPAANGLVERANQTIKQMIRLLTASGDKWPDTLPYIVFCYNTGYQDSTRYSPFYLVYGRDAVLPLDVVYNRRQLAELRDASDYAAQVRENLAKARQLASKHIKLAQEKQKRLFDKNRIDVSFEKDQLVLLKSPPVGLKKRSVYGGPHRIVRKLSPVNYEIELDSTGGCEVVHVEKLKPYLQPLAQLQQQ